MKSIKLSFLIIFLNIFIKLSWISFILVSVKVDIISSNIRIRLSDISITLLAWRSSVYLALDLSLSTVVVLISLVNVSNLPFNKVLFSLNLAILVVKSESDFK